MPKVSIPEDFICPISHEVMRDPVATSDGQVYERKEIEEWLGKHGTSPSTGKELPNKNLIPVPLIKRQIQAYLEKICTQEAFLKAVQEDKALSIEKLNYTHAHLEAKDKDGLTPIERAVYYGHESMRKYLEACQELKEGDVDESYLSQYRDDSQRDLERWRDSPERRTPLILAVSNGYVNVVRLLLKEGAKPLEVTDYLNTDFLSNLLVTLGKSRSDISVAHCSCSLLALAVQNGHAEIVKLLLAAGADPHDTIKESYATYSYKVVSPFSTLHLAAINGHVEIIKILISAGANLEATFNYDFISGITALTSAIINNRIEAVKALIEAGANLENTLMIKRWREEQYTPIGIAASLGHIEIVKLLINAGAKLNGDDKSIIYYYPLHAIGTGAKFDWKDSIIYPLHAAAKNGQLEVIKALLEGGASPKLTINHIDPNDPKLRRAPIHTPPDYDPPITHSDLKSRKTPIQTAIENNQPQAAKFITDYHQELKQKKNEAAFKLIELEKTIKDQQAEIEQSKARIQQLEEQLRKVLTHLQLQANQPEKPTYTPALFKQ